MGTTHSLFSPEFETFLSNYKQVSDGTDNLLGIVMEKKVNKSEKILLATKVFESTHDLEASMKLAQTLQEYKHPNVANVLAHSEKNEFQCRSQSFKHALAVE